jgi:hypothetical protein
MKEASECRERAAVCDNLAPLMQDATATRLLRDLAVQWRRLAEDADQFKRQADRRTTDDKA